MRKKLGILSMLLGIVLVLGALLLILKNRQEDQIAQEFSNDKVVVLKEQIHRVQ